MDRERAHWEAVGGEQVQDGKILGRQDAVKAFQTEGTLAIEEIGDVSLLEFRRRARVAPVRSPRSMRRRISSRRFSRRASKFMSEQ